MSINPYDSPQSDLTSEAVLPRKAPGAWWKVYFFFQMFMSLLGYVVLIAIGRINELANILDVFETVLFIISTIGVGGFVFNKGVFRPRFWRYFYYIYLAVFVIGVGRWAFWIVENVHLMDDHNYRYYRTIFSRAMSCLFTIPTCVALFRYGSPSGLPWRDKNIDLKAENEP